VRGPAKWLSAHDEAYTTVKLFDRVLNPREIRRRLGLNQEQFWTQIGVTQSGGSRYESGREMPKPVRELLRLVHVEQIDLSQVKRVDFEIISYLKEAHPDLYRTLRRAVKGRSKAGGPPIALDDAALGLPPESTEVEDVEAATADAGIQLPAGDGKSSHSL
jgi:transcriptional regulator with XRE-family HTH domain